MKTGAEAKLADLRRKTDRQLTALVVRKLERARTPRACEEIRPLLRLLPHGDRRPMEQRLQEIAEELRSTAQTACC
jgi:hypothetical protein